MSGAGASGRDNRTMADVGERAAVALMAEALGLRAAVDGVIVGPGDDAAVLDIDGRLVISSDVVSKSTHSSGDWDPQRFGEFAAAVNFSDIAAMGAKPVGLTVSLLKPRSAPLDWMLGIMAGVKRECDLHGASVLGGDTKEGAAVSAAITAIGSLAGKPLTRSGAREGDLLAVTGPMGIAAAGHLALAAGLGVPDDMAQAALRPRARVREGLILSSTGAATSCMDVSDGLSAAVHELSRRSGVFFEVDLASVPSSKDAWDVADVLDWDRRSVMLDYGGDYELLFTFPPEREEELRQAWSALPDRRFHVIGRAKGDRNMLIADGEAEELQDGGWEHFIERRESPSGPPEGG